jgi:hypothetical protein
MRYFVGLLHGRTEENLRRSCGQDSGWLCRTSNPLCYHAPNLPLDKILEVCFPSYGCVRTLSTLRAGFIALEPETRRPRRRAHPVRSCSFALTYSSLCKDTYLQQEVWIVSRYFWQRSGFGFTFQNITTPLRMWEESGHSALLLSLSLSLSLLVRALLPFQFALGSYSPARDRYTDPYGIWRDLHCLCSVAIINTNVGHKVWELWLCFSNMRNVSALARTHTHTHAQRISLFHSARHQLRADYTFCSPPLPPIPKFCLALRMHKALAATTIRHGSESPKEIALAHVPGRHRNEDNSREL